MVANSNFFGKMHISYSYADSGFLQFITDAFIIFFGLWTIVHQISYFAGLTFHQCWTIAWFISFLGIVLFFIVSRIWMFSFKSNMNWVICLGVISAITLTLCLLRSSLDDEEYLGLAVLALDFESHPMKSLPGLYTGYAMTSYEFLRACFASATGIPLLASYYFVFPGLISVFVVVFQWRLMRLLSVDNMAIALCVFFIVMLTWGDTRRTPPNYGFVRLFQGKGALVWLVIPAVQYYWLQYIVNSDSKSFFLMFFAVVAGTGFSPTGAPIGLLVITVLIFATFIRLRSFGSMIEIICLGMIAIYPLAIGLLMKFYFGHSSPGVHTKEGMRAIHGFSDLFINSEMLRFVFGDGMRGIMALFSFAIFPWVLRVSKYKILMKTFSEICLAMILFPLTSSLLGILGFATMSWRWLWIVPFGLAIVVVVDRLCSLGTSYYARLTIAGVLVATFVVVSPSWVISENNKNTRFALPAYKLQNVQHIVLRPAPYNNSVTKVEGPWLISPISGKRF